MTTNEAGGAGGAVGGIPAHDTSQNAAQSRRASPLEDDRMPSSRTGRVAELGVLGVRLSAVALQAGAANLFHSGEERERRRAALHADAAAALAHALGRMRGVATKFGQLLVQQPGLLPDQYVDTLFELTSRVPPMGYPMVKTQFVAQFGRSPPELFARFDRQAFAAASFGQVHAARLDAGVELAVKVQYPAVERGLRADLQNLALLVKAVARFTALHNADQLIAEIEEQLLRELDYTREGADGERFRRLFEQHPVLFIPRVVPELTRSRILTTEYVDGVDVRRFLASGPSEQQRLRLSEALLDLGWVSLYRHAVLHADPNPGNYLFTRDGRLGVIDFGCVKQFDAEFVDDLRRLMSASLRGDDAGLDDAIRRAGLLSASATRSDAESVRLLVQQWGRPFATNAYDFSDRSYLDGLLKMQQLIGENRRLAVSMPRHWVFYARHIIGTAHLLHQLRAKGDFRAAFEPFLAEVPPASAASPTPHPT